MYVDTVSCFTCFTGAAARYGHHRLGLMHCHCLSRLVYGHVCIVLSPAPYGMLLALAVAGCGVAAHWAPDNFTLLAAFRTTYAVCLFVSSRWLLVKPA